MIRRHRFASTALRIAFLAAVALANVLAARWVDGPAADHRPAAVAAWPPAPAAG